jgi:hypothetical protein
MDERAAASNLFLIEDYLARSAAPHEGESGAPPAAGGAL